MGIRLRQATLDDTGTIAALIDASVRQLQASDYSEGQREGALGTVFGVDRSLIRDGTYFLAMDEGTGTVAGCGGWSFRRTLFGSDHVDGKDDARLDPATESARIRAFFIRPGWERRGIGSLILEACEQAARHAGFTRLELGATLTGIPLYARHGFEPFERVEVPLPNGLTLPIVKMRKITA